MLVFGLMLWFGNRTPKGGATSRVAPAFTLASTAGGQVSLSDYAGRDVLLYFSEGVGCDPCFTQMVDFEQNAQRFEEAGVTVVPIVANPASQVIPELQRFGLKTPYLIDADTSVSAAYGRLGQGMHANLPGHGFVLVDGAGKIRWQMEYPSMYVSSADLLKAIHAYL